MKKIYMPPAPPDGTAMNKHHLQYKRFATTGDIEVCYDQNVDCGMILSEAESWSFFNPYIKRHGMTNIDIKLSDKSTNQELFASVDLPTLATVTMDSVQAFKGFKDNNIPFIIKPSLSGGSAGLVFTYNVFNNFTVFKNVLSKIYNNNTYGFQFLMGNSYIIQEAVTRKDVPYGQLYVEGFVNGNSEIFFSSIHEIEFLAGRWTGQLKWNTEDDNQIITIKEKLQKLLKDRGVKNCMFLLQFLRDFDDGVWKPTDWQYRLSYNTLWGRTNFEPEYCAQLMNYMSDQIPAVTERSTLQYYQSYINYTNGDTKIKSNLENIMKDMRIVPIPIPKNDKDDSRKFLFITADKTFEEARERMNKFADIIA